MRIPKEKGWEELFHFKPYIATVVIETARQLIPAGSREEQRQAEGAKTALP